MQSFGRRIFMAVSGHCHCPMEITLPTHFLLMVFFLFCLMISANSNDYDSLLALKSSIDPSSSLPWPQGMDFCRWKGVKACLRGRVVKLVLEFRNLNGSLDEKSLNQLDQLRVLSFKANSLSGAVPNLRGLTNLKSLYLNYNQLSGEFPASVSSLHRLKIIALSGNRISGRIPASLNKLVRLYTLLLQDNLLTGEVPPLNQTSLSFLNVSNNRLSGEIPATQALLRFNSSSFSNNLNLCGKQVEKPCHSLLIPPSTSPRGSFSMEPPAEENGREGKKRKKKKLIISLIACIAGLLLLLICLRLLWIIFKKKSREKGKVVEGGGEVGGGGEASGSGDGANADSKGGFAWEEGGVGSLVFCGGGSGGGERMTYTMEDLLRASAETLGRGTMGSTYKAVMESGFIVTVKRLKDGAVGVGGPEEFRLRVEALGRLRHPNLVPLRAYFQAKEERLLVYDYFPNGSLFSLIHGSKPTGRGKPLHWTSCLKIAEDLASGLVYLHETAGLVHGNLKSSNVLLGSDFESCLTDYGLHVFKSPDPLEEGGTSASSLFYRAPECRPSPRSFTQQSDVYSFGVLLLELLTGKTPFQDLVQEHGADIPKWVRSVREEEADSGDDPASGNEASEEKLNALLNIAVSCVSPVAENRPAMKDVLRMVRETRSEVHLSSNSSEHSPGRWSDTVQGLPRDHGSEHLSFTERD